MLLYTYNMCDMLQDVCEIIDEGRRRFAKVLFRNSENR